MGGTAADGENVIEFSQLSVQTSASLSCKGSRTIFSDVNGRIRRSRLTAVMGPSGSGKSTFMDALSGRLARNLKLTGTVRHVTTSGKAERSIRTVKTAYVRQHDILLASATVEEAVWTSAHLRLPQFMSLGQKRQRVNDVIGLLGLEKVRKSRIGDELVRGVSGGEKKRTAVAVELVTDPTLVFMDEPTTGLDAAMALSVVNTMQALVKAGRSVVCTIHQPRSNIFELFDDIILIAPGGFVYTGPAQEVVSYFAGLEPPVRMKSQFTNPADFLIDILCDDNGITCEDRYSPLQKQYKEKWEEIMDGPKVIAGPPPLSDPAKTDMVAPESVNMDSKGEPSPDTHHAHHSIFQSAGLGQAWPPFQFMIIAQRAFRNSYRDSATIWAEVTQYIGFAVLTGLMFLRAGNDQSGVLNKQSALFFGLINVVFVPAFSIVQTFPKIRALYNRERASHAYGTMPFYLAYLVVDTPRHYFFAIVFGVITYWMVGFEADAGKFFIHLVIYCFTLDFTASVTLLISSVVTKPAVGNLLVTVLLIIWLTFMGYVISDSNIPDYYAPFKYGSVLRYAFRAICVNEFKGQTGYTCDSDELCFYDNGDDVLEDLGFKGHPIWIDLLIMFAVAAACKFMGYFTLRFILVGQK